MDGKQNLFHFVCINTIEILYIQNLSNCSTRMNQKKTYDDISFQDRKKLIYLINEEKWTIKAAAHEIGIKLCTAKHILYLYRKQGKIYSKKGEFLEPSQHSDKSDDVSPDTKVVYVPYPYFILCCVPPEQISISLEHLLDK